MSSPRYLLVDGHSVIHAWPELRALHRRQPRQAREELVRKLRYFHDVGNWNVTIVFDGKSGPTAEPRRPGDLVVAYSRGDQTADSVIEALVAAQPAQASAGQAARANVTVVTADEAERVTVEALGSYCVSPEWLRLEMESAQADFDETFRQAKRREKW